jgi:hypothetical protein
LYDFKPVWDARDFKDEIYFTVTLVCDKDCGIEVTMPVLCVPENITNLHGSGNAHTSCYPVQPMCRYYRRLEAQMQKALDAELGCFLLEPDQILAEKLGLKLTKIKATDTQEVKDPPTFYYRSNGYDIKQSFHTYDGKPRSGRHLCLFYFKFSCKSNKMDILKRDTDI